MHPLASSANCCFQYSNPAAEVPHCAAFAAVPIHCVNKSETATALNHPKVCMISSRQHKNETLLCRSRQEGVPNRNQLRLTPLRRPWISCWSALVRATQKTRKTAECVARRG